GEELPHFRQRKIDDFGAGFLDQCFRRADDQFNVAASSVLALCAHWLQTGLVEHPLNGSVEQNGVVEIRYLPVEPEVNAGNRRIFEFRDLLANGTAFRRIREQGIESIEWKGQD